MIAELTDDRARIAALTKSLAGQINATYAEYRGCDAGIREWVIRKCNKARDIGILLQSFRDDCAHGNWKLLFKLDGKSTSTCIFDFSYQTGHNLISYAKANPNPIVSLPEAIKSVYDHMIWTGAIDAPQGHGQQQRSALTWLDRVSLTFGKARELFNGQVEKMGGDLRRLPVAERDALEVQTKPVAELHAKLVALRQ